ncbi:MAG TPA: CU044_2847 family protein [Micromonosporaceae bacterium]|nr:CU044_2847 family protein [Micromonosporaceae bacterium]
MAQAVPVSASGVEFYAEVDTPSGPSNVALDRVFSFDGVRETVQAISWELLQAWEAVRPDEASVEFALTLKVTEGRLTGLLVSGGAEGALKVTLSWRRGTDSTTDAGIAGGVVAG